MLSDGFPRVAVWTGLGRESKTRFRVRTTVGLLAAGGLPNIRHSYSIFWGGWISAPAIRSLSVSELKRLFVLMAFVVLPFSACAQEEETATEAETSEETPSEGIPYREIIIGDADAPLTIIEYASLVCPACSAFHTEVYPALKEEYIDTGRVRFVFRDFPTAPVQLAMAGSMLARCAPEGREALLLTTMFKRQREWVTSRDPRAALVGYAKLAGMSEESVDTCLQDQALFDKIVEVRDEAVEQFAVGATPTFFIGQEKLEGFRTLEDFTEIVDRNLP